MSLGARTARIILFVVALLGLQAAPALAADAESARAPNGLAMTPPMGWNSWNRFGCNIDEKVIRDAADAMVASGMRDAGYQYVVIDDCWHGERDAHGDIQADPKRFPSGIKALADYVHSKGLKFGIYSDAGRKTCAGRPGSRGYEFQDARQYAAWGVDYLKYDWCSTDSQDARASYETMSDALRATGRPIVFSLCEWGSHQPWLWAQNVGNLWRTTGDISATWEKGPISKAWEHSILDILDQQVGLDGFAGPGHWNDPDMLEVGNGSLTPDEAKAHFSLWAMLAAPLITGNDLANMPADVHAILTNREVIAVDQDTLGAEGRRVAKDGDFEVWARPLKDGGRAVILLNRGKAAHQIEATWEELGYPAHLTASVRDLWAARDLPRARGSFSAEVPPHGVVMVRIEP